MTMSGTRTFARMKRISSAFGRPARNRNVGGMMNPSS